MKSLRTLSLTLLSIGFGTGAFAQTSGVSQIVQLDQLEQDQAVYNRSLFTELGRFKKYDEMPMLTGLLEMKERVAWLRERFRKPDADYRIGYALAVYQWKMGDTYDAALTLARADLRSFADSQRCDDKSSPPSRIGPWRSAAQPVYVVIQKLAPEQKVEVRKAIEQEETNVHLRPRSAWMCSGGAKHIIKILQKYPELGGVDVSQPIPQTVLDKYPSVVSIKDGRVELTDFSIQPDFIADEVWRRDLSVMIEAFKKSYFSALALN